MCHVVCQIIIIFWRFPSTEKLFYSFCSCPDIDRWWQHPSPEHKQAKQYYKSIQHPPKKTPNQKTKHPRTFRFGGGEVREKGWGEKEVMNPNLYYGLGGGCADAKVLWAWLLSLHDGTVLVFPEDLQHEAAEIARFVFVFFWRDQIIQWWDPFWGNQT